LIQEIIMQNNFKRIRSYRLPVWQNWILILSTLVLFMMVSACGPSAEQASNEPMESPVNEATAVPPTPEEEEAPAYPATDGYPPSLSNTPQVAEAYPLETLPPPSPTPIPDIYPPPTVAEVFAEPRIRLDLPISVGDTVITGQAPAGLALAVIDVTYNGALLGQGKTGDDERFSIPVNGLVEGNRLGLTFGELEPGLSIADMAIKYYPYRGEGFMNIPNVGVILDSTLIAP
jgi:hypothetical protein